jgi:hypothetical protein
VLIVVFCDQMHQAQLPARILRVMWIYLLCEFDMAGDYDLEQVRSVYDYSLEALLHVPNVNNVVEQKLTSVLRDFYQMVVPRLVSSGTSGFDVSLIFFTYSSKSGVLIGFGVYHSGGPESSFRLKEPI